MTSGRLEKGIEIFGEFIEEFPPEHDSLELTFTPSSRPIKQRWRNNRISAHFVADYLSSFLPVDEQDFRSEKRIKQSKGAVSYIANELLENAIKFSDDDCSHKVRFGIHFIGEDDVTAVIYATNYVKQAAAHKFQEFINELLISDSNDLYLQQLEKNAEIESETSGLGLLTMINDYDAKIGWKFESIADSVPMLAITTLVQISV
ncbi:MAG: ATP-binding protein [Oscillatoriales cyanobacterium]|uniref:DUF6272 family protein n=1 Tax=Microcoleus anatoxicus PTRS2 TaxID=2705321 RepID=A0ABU8YIS6_9CYAN|nr:MAG: ATP-binding protein [Oscillatoriales cyanobacterium]TAD97557.1 MAG: ATP-binding protein [Oscillatoriales cyanobacterium]TAE06636.1 MAG: ATP-binding protein [Oscillatoriales cyanobacterium]